jgi:hypothetical protein
MNKLQLPERVERFSKYNRYAYVCFRVLCIQLIMGSRDEKVDKYGIPLDILGFYVKHTVCSKRFPKSISVYRRKLMKYLNYV